MIVDSEVPSWKIHGEFGCPHMADGFPQFACKEEVGMLCLEEGLPVRAGSMLEVIQDVRVVGVRLLLDRMFQVHMTGIP